MTRLFVMTFFGQRALDRRTSHPHESPPVDDGPDDRPRGRLGRRRASCCSYVRRLEHWLEPVVGLASPRASPCSRCCVITGRRCSLVVARASVLGLAHVRACARCPRSAPARSRVLTRAARRDLTATRSTRRVFMRPGQYLTRALVYVDNRGIDGAVTAWPPRRRRLAAGCAGCRPASCAPTRCPCSRGARPRRSAPWLLVRSDDVSDFPLLTVLGARAAASARSSSALLPREPRPLAKQLALVFSLRRRSCSASPWRWRFERRRRRASSSPSPTRGSRPSGCSFALGVDGIALVLLAADRGAGAAGASWPPGTTPTPTRRRSVQALLRAAPGCSRPDDRRLRGHRRLPVLRLLRGHARPDVLPHRLATAGRSGSTRR